MRADKRSCRPSLAKNGRKSGGRRRAAIVPLALAGVLAVGGTAAFLIAKTDPTVNEFLPSSVATEVVETLSGSEKSDVYVANSGEADSYVRAAIVVTWQNEGGSVYGQAPVEGTDYILSIASDDQDGKDGKWAESSDGFYYWSDSVAADEATGVLISSCSYVANAPEGYFLNVEVLASAIQAEGSDADGNAPVDAWDSDLVDVTRNDDGTLTVTAKA